MAHVISSADLLALYTGYKSTYEDTFDSVVPQFEGVYGMETSEMEREAYPISAMTSIMERWNGDRTFSDLLTKVVYVDNGVPFQKAFAIKRRDLELRKKIQIEAAAKAHGKAAKLLEDDLIVTALQGGASAVWAPDGLFFFAATGAPHLVTPWDSSQGTWFNLRTSFGLTAANAQTILTDLRSRKGWDGRSMNFSQFEIIVPSALEFTARRIFEQEFSSDPGVSTAGGNSNVLFRRATVRVCSALDAEPTVWYMRATDGDPPFVIQEWRPLEIVRRFDLTSEAVFSRDEYQIGSSRGVEGARMLPHGIVRCET